MSKTYLALAAIAAATALALSACGGGGGGAADTAAPAAPVAPTPPTPPSPPPAPTPPATAVVVSGMAAAGVVAGAVVTFYDASTSTGLASDTPLATTATDASGRYQATLPAGFAKTLLIRVAGRADGSTTVRDEVFGLTAVNERFVMQSVVPAALLAQAGGQVTAHVTTYTHAMAAYVGNRLGRADIDDAVVTARTLVSSHLTGGADPLTTAPNTQAKMVALLASASNIANATNSTLRNDPDGCAAKAGPADKIACTLRTVAGILQPLPAVASGTSALQFNLPHATALSNAAKALDVAVVASNTGLPASELTAGKAAATATLEQTESAALAATAASDSGPLFLPPIGITIERAARTIVTSGPQAGDYQGWTYRLSQCLGAVERCADFSVQATVTPEDVMEDPGIVAAAQRAALALASEVAALQRTVYAKGRQSYPSAQTFINAVNAGFPQGLKAQSVEAAMAATRAALAAAGFPVDAGNTAGGSGAAAAATPEQIAAAKACVAPEAYVNTSSPVFDPQLDSHCRLAQVNACFHRAGITAYDEQGRAACRIVNDMIARTTGTFRCSYCSPSYPF